MNIWRVCPAQYRRECGVADNSIGSPPNTHTHTAAFLMNGAQIGREKFMQEPNAKAEKEKER